MDSVKKSTIYQLINENTFTNLKNKLLTEDNICVKEKDNMAIIYSEDTNSSANSCRSVIIDTETMELVATQFNRILYNSKAIDYIKKVDDWNKITFQPLYDGSVILVYYHRDKWHISTRRCIEGDEAKWVKDTSCLQMFNDAKDNVFTFDELNKNHCYYFLLSHYKNKGLMDNFMQQQYTDSYAKLFHFLTVEKGTSNIINCTINSKVDILPVEKFDNLENVISKIKMIGKENELNKMITNEGYLVRIKEKQDIVFCKLQTYIYQKLIKLKPNNSNSYQIYLELYQQNLLNDVLPFYTNYSNDIISRIHKAMLTLTKEILNIYFLTRNKKHPNIYNILSNQILIWDKKNKFATVTW